MRKEIFVFLLFFPLFTFTQNTYQAAKDFQDELNDFYADSSTSPLTEKDRLAFEGLPFYPIDTNLIITANVELLTDEEIIEMETTTDRLPLYRPYYQATFKIDSIDCSLTIFQSEDLKTTAGYEDYLFLPFTDFTNGDGSYGGGRYIDLKITDSDSIVIDFNRAYNPYCAYNKKYSCPIPPRQNDVNCAIKAGVKYTTQIE